MLKETARKIYLDENMNCAEATLRAANRDYGLGLGEDDFKLIAGFGGGCGCGHLCGAVAGGIAAIGRMTVRTKANETPNLGPRCAAFMDACKKRLGGVLCEELKRSGYEPALRCSPVVMDIAEILEEQIGRYE